MPLRIEVKSEDISIKARRKEAADRVINRFGNQLPDLRLLCFFDDQDWQGQKERREASRGFFMTITYGDPFWKCAPAYISDSVFSNPWGPPDFDRLIYLHGSTCANDVGLTMTFAHELQHFIQHSNMLTLWAANKFVYDHFRESASNSALGLKTFSLPHEREARIVAKRTAENLHGAEDVRQYIDTQIANPATADSAANWEFIQGIDTSAPYDLAGETKLMFRRLRPYRSELEEQLQTPEWKNDPHFKYVDLDRLFDGTGV